MVHCEHVRHILRPAVHLYLFSMMLTNTAVAIAAAVVQTARDQRLMCLTVCLMFVYCAVML
jgi:hypothetical protein